MLQIGDEIGGHYILEKPLAEGGMGTVWLARHIDEQVEKRYAIKFLKEEFLRDQELRSRFLVECQIQKELRHPNIVRAYISIPEPPCLVMAFVDGQSLSTRISAAKGPLDIKTIVSVSRDILGALAFAHEFPGKGVVHRDVKPSNILIDQNGRALLTDFGIALVEGEVRRTRTGTVIGSDHYMSPEQVTMEPIDHRTDIYSFGCVLYEMLTGVPPFAGDPNPLPARVKTIPVLASKRNGAAPKEFDRVVAICLSRDPGARWENCRELLAELEKVADRLGETRKTTSEPVQPVEPPEVVVPGRQFGLPARLLATLAGAAGAVALLVALYFYFNRPTEELMFRMYGSSSVGDDLAPALAKKFLESNFGASRTGCYDIKVVPYKGKDYKLYHCSGDAPGTTLRPAIEIYSPGSSLAFECLADKTCEIGMSSNPVNAQNSPGLEEHVVGLDGIAIIVHRQNNLEALSMDQVRRVFCDVPGRFTDWSDLGVAGKGRIELFVRDENSGTRKMFESMVCTGTRLAQVPEDHQGVGDFVAGGVASANASIGFVTSTAAGSARIVPLSAGRGLPARRPDTFVVATEDYALTRRLFLYMAPDRPTNKDAMRQAAKFIKFAASEEGQRVAVEQRIVPLIAEAQPLEVPPDSPAAIRQYAQGMKRLSLSFRFASGNTNVKLDTLASDNIDRVVAYAGRNPGARFVVVGFTDKVQSRDRRYNNQWISERRADAVKRALTDRGLTIEDTRGFAENMLVDSNQTDSNKNRRAEIWIR